MSQRSENLSITASVVLFLFTTLYGIVSCGNQPKTYLIPASTPHDPYGKEIRVTHVMPGSDTLKIYVNPPYTV